MTEAAALEWSFRPWRDARRTSLLALAMVLGGVALVVWLVEPGGMDSRAIACSSSHRAMW